MGDSDWRLPPQSPWNSTGVWAYGRGTTSGGVWASGTTREFWMRTLRVSRCSVGAASPLRSSSGEGEGEGEFVPGVENARGVTVALIGGSASVPRSISRGLAGWGLASWWGSFRPRHGV
eukprot:4874283-Pyramimonas_sp.AAC.1